MKQCIRCKVIKPTSEFYKNKATSDGLHYYCKSCKKELYQIHYKNNQDYYKKYRENYIQKNTEYYKEYYQENKERILNKSKEYYKENKKSHRDSVYEWRNKNRDKYNEYRREYKKTKSKQDSLFRLKNIIGSRTASAFKLNGWSKNSKTQQMLGADYKTVMSHIESRFKKGMTWDNKGEWHIDHIIPLASAKTEQELIQLCHYTNLQPLWAEENISKGDKIIACRINL